MATDSRHAGYYEIWLHDENGLRIELLQPVWFEYCRVANASGFIQVQLPRTYDHTKIKKDAIISAWRSPPSGGFSLELAGFYRKLYAATDDSGYTQLQLYGEGANDLLKRRICSFYVNTAETAKTGYLDDIMKDIVRENLGVSAGSDRTISNLAGGFTVAPNMSKGEYASYNFAHSNLAETLSDIADYSKNLGTRLYYDVVPTLGDTSFSFWFTTYTGQRGVDRTDKLFFSDKRSNISRVQFTKDAMNEGTVAYIGGKGSGAVREITVVESDKKDESIWNRREIWAFGQYNATDEEVIAAGKTAISDKRERILLQAGLLSSDNAVYGVDWNFGDKVRIEYASYSFDAYIDLVQVSWSSDGNETIYAVASADSILSVLR